MGGLYDINIAATTHGVTDRVRIILKVSSPPKADFLAVPKAGLTPLTVDFYDKSISASKLVSWSWSFGDGSTGTEQNPEHTYESEGPFDVKLTVTDDQGLTDTVTKKIYPYSIVTVKNVYANNIHVGEDVNFGASCNKDVSGKLEVVFEQTGQVLFSMKDYNCNSGPAHMKLDTPGIYYVHFRLNTTKCSQCAGAKYFTVMQKKPGLATPESPITAFLVALFFVLFFRARKAVQH